MVLISYREYCRIKKNSDNFLHKKINSSLTDESKGHGAMEIEEPSQLPNTEIPKQDIYQEKYANAVLSENPSNSHESNITLSKDGKNKTKNIIIPKANEFSDTWYYIGIPKCMEEN